MGDRSARTEERVLLELFLDTPSVVIDELDAPAAQRAGVRVHRHPGRVDTAAAHTADVALDRDLPVLTGRPAALRAIAPEVGIEELPEF